MKNKLLFILLIFFLVSNSSCRKNLVGNEITITLSTNDTLSFLRFYKSCQAGPGGMPSGTFNTFDDHGNGNYSFIVEEGYKNACFMVAGAITENNDSSGTTVLNINAFYTKEGNIVGFDEIKLKRPHDKFQIRYEFRPDTYLEGE